ASETEIIWVMRVGIFITGALSTVMALTIPTIYGLWGLSSDLVYCILFPQLCMVVHFKHHCNTYGSLAGYIVGLMVRLSGGEDVMKIPPLILYPGYNYETKEQMFPFRTLAMVMCGITVIVVSRFTKYLFESHILAPKWDVFKCVVNVPDDVQKFPTPPEGELTVMNSAAVQKYAATEEINEMNGRVNPALTLSDSDDEDAPPRAAHKTRKRTTSTSQSGGGEGSKGAGGRGSVSSAAAGGPVREGSMSSARKANIITANGSKEGKIGQTSL
ncbi:high-affinity choline transporter 1-like, partial [Amphibalanus amphitrite]|uniref:high-affinity choline transporter 1-like n=1 Tax=Amphibalanus amphitrite TaxID=1232801 RepID=UPI001C9166F7